MLFWYITVNISPEIKSSETVLKAKKRQIFERCFRGNNLNGNLPKKLQIPKLNYCIYISDIVFNFTILFQFFSTIASSSFRNAFND